MADSRTEACRISRQRSSGPESKDVLKTKQKHRQGHMPMEQEPTGSILPVAQSSNNLSNKKTKKYELYQLFYKIFTCKSMLIPINQVNE